jgi:putative hydrolase of HD superfamily
MNIDELLGFLREIDRLKSVERQTLLHNGGRRENSAEHSWHLALSVIVLHALAEPGTDLLKSIKMALIHDLVEIDAGDTFVYDDLSSKNSKESAAIVRLTKMLPGSLGEELRELWFEFEAGQSKEARLVSGVDRFLPLYSNYLNQGHSWMKHGITLDRIVAKTQAPIKNAIPELWETAAQMLKESAERGHVPI